MGTILLQTEKTGSSPDAADIGGGTDKTAFLNRIKLSPAIIRGALTFTAFTLLFSLTTMKINAAVALCFGSEAVPVFYAVGLLLTAAGFAAFGLSYKKWGCFCVYNIVLTSLSGILYTATLFCIAFSTDGVAVCGSALLCPFIYGAIGGGVHYKTAMILADSPHLGKLIGGAYCVSVFIQYFIQRISENTVISVVFLLTALLSILWEYVATSKRYDGVRRIPAKKPPAAVSLRSVWVLVGTIIAVALMLGIYDGMAAELYARNEVNLAGWPRLLVGIGAVAAGYIYDIGRRTALNSIILCVALVNIVNLLLLTTTRCYQLAQILFTSGMGFYVVYMVVSFMSVAPKTANPPLVAGAGRIGHSLAMSVTTPLAGVFGVMAPAALDGIAVALFMVTFLLFLLGGRLVIYEKAPDNGFIPSGKERLSDFSKRYRLTQREAEVFAILLDSEATNKDIAGELFVSTRVLERNITAIYEKPARKPVSV